MAAKGVAAMGVAAEAKAGVGCSQTYVSLVQLVSLTRDLLDSHIEPTMGHICKGLLIAYARYEASTAATCIWPALAAEAVAEKGGVEKGAAGCTTRHRGRQLDTPQPRVQGNQMASCQQAMCWELSPPPCMGSYLGGGGDGGGGLGGGLQGLMRCCSPASMVVLDSGNMVLRTIGSRPIVDVTT